MALFPVLRKIIKKKHQNLHLMRYGFVMAPSTQTRSRLISTTRYIAVLPAGLGICGVTPWTSFIIRVSAVVLIKASRMETNFSCIRGQDNVIVLP